MNTTRGHFLLIIALAAALSAGGCVRKPILRPSTEETAATVSSPAEDSVVPAAVPAPDESAEPSIRKGSWESVPSLRTIEFGYDQDTLSDEARAIIARNAYYLKSNPSLQIIVEGHTDERGTIAYNLALGQRRASVVREHYGKLGLSLARIGTLSFGEEKPADPRHSEAAWSRNRRAETKVRKAS